MSSDIECLSKVWHRSSGRREFNDGRKLRIPNVEASWHYFPHIGRRDSIQGFDSVTIGAISATEATPTFAGVFDSTPRRLNFYGVVECNLTGIIWITKILTGIKCVLGFKQNPVNAFREVD